MAPWIDNVLENYHKQESYLDERAERQWKVDFINEMKTTTIKFLTGLALRKTREEQIRYIEEGRRLGRDHNPSNQSSRVPFLDLTWLEGSFDPKEVNGKASRYNIRCAFGTEIPSEVIYEGRKINIDVEDFGDLISADDESLEDEEQRIRALIDIMTQRKDCMIPIIKGGEEEERFSIVGVNIEISKDDPGFKEVFEGMMIFNDLAKIHPE